MKIFLDYNDKRTKYLHSKLNYLQTLEATNDNYALAEPGDFVVFPPNKKWTDEEINSIPSHVTLFCGKVDNKYNNIFKEKNIKYINFLDDELFAIENARLTAEGVLSIVIERSPKSFLENNILLLGCGRISKMLAKIFLELHINFAIASFNESSFFEAHYFSKNVYLGYNFLKDIQKFDIIINTRPFEFFDEKQISKISSNTLFVETASKDCLNEQLATHFSYIKAPALPQKYCFESASNLLLKKILGEMKWLT